MNKFLKNKNFYLAIALFSIFTLLSAVYVEYVLGAKPCKLCIYQRIPYIVAIFLCFFGYSNLKKNIWIYLVSLTFLISFLISGYHTGIENNIFDEFSGCTSNNLNITNKDDLTASIPPDWEKISETYQKKLKVLSLAQRKYRRAMDDAYAGIDETIKIIASGQSFVSFKDDFFEMKSSLMSLSKDEKQTLIKTVSKNLNNIPGGSKLKSLLNKARKEYKKDNKEKANTYLFEAEALLNDEISFLY